MMGREPERKSGTLEITWAGNFPWDAPRLHIFLEKRVVTLLDTAEIVSVDGEKIPGHRIPPNKFYGRRLAKDSRYGTTAPQLAFSRYRIRSNPAFIGHASTRDHEGPIKALVMKAHAKKVNGS
jgi:hypothetical protein